MRRSRWFGLILGVFFPLVIGAQPFGETSLTVFDASFLPVPAGPAPALPSEAPVPAWTPVVTGGWTTDLTPQAPWGES